MRSLLKLMRPDNFEDISAVHRAVPARPHGRELAHQLRAAQERPAGDRADPSGAGGTAADILGTTYGLIVYQEQVMAIAQKLAGFSLGQADILRRAMGKKKKSELDKQFAGFSQGMVDNGYSEAAVKTLWDILLPFSDYAFNKAHSAAYGVVSYWTAYLKAHYPAEYMAALLTSVGDDKDKLALYLNECRHMGITVLPPDVNESSAELHPGRQGHPLRHGRRPQRRRQRRRRHGRAPARRRATSPVVPATSCRRSRAVVCNKRTIESLIKAGAFDSLGPPAPGAGR